MCLPGECAPALRCGARFAVVPRHDQGFGGQPHRGAPGADLCQKHQAYISVRVPVGLCGRPWWRLVLPCPSSRSREPGLGPWPTARLCACAEATLCLCVSCGCVSHGCGPRHPARVSGARLSAAQATESTACACLARVHLRCGAANALPCSHEPTRKLDGNLITELPAQIFQKNVELKHVYVYQWAARAPLVERGSTAPRPPVQESQVAVLSHRQGHAHAPRQPSACVHVCGRGRRHPARVTGARLCAAQTTEVTACAYPARVHLRCVAAHALPWFHDMTRDLGGNRIAELPAQIFGENIKLEWLYVCPFGCAAPFGTTQLYCTPFTGAKSRNSHLPPRALCLAHALHTRAPAARSLAQVRTTHCVGTRAGRHMHPQVPEQQPHHGDASWALPHQHRAHPGHAERNAMTSLPAGVFGTKGEQR